MRPSFVLTILGFAGIVVGGCDNITGIGNLTFSDTVGSSDAGGSSDSGSGLSVYSGPIPPSGLQVAKSSSLALRGMTTDGYVAYVDTSSNALSAVGVELPDGGPAGSSSPVTLGPSVPATSNVEGVLVLFFSLGTETTLGPSHAGTLNAWSSSMAGPKQISAGVLEPVFGASSFFTVLASADGQYVAFLGSVASDGATASLYLQNVQTGARKQLVGPIDVLRDACQPRIRFSGSYVVASYCQVPSGATVDAGASSEIATVSSFAVDTGQATTLATSVSPHFGADPGGVAAIMFGANGLEASAISGAGGVVPIDSDGTSAIISQDGQTTVYATSSNALKRAGTSPPVSPTVLAPGSFAFVKALSSDTSWVIGGLTQGSQSGTSDLYAASANNPGSPITLSSATTASVGSAGSSFTADSQYALYLTNVSSSATGTLNAYLLGGSGRGGAITVGTGTYQVEAATGSQVVFNTNESSGKADLGWEDLSVSDPPTVIATKANDFFLLGPARGQIVYTSAGGAGTSDGLWVAPVPTPVSLATCPAAGPMVFHPPVGPTGACTTQQVATFDASCVASGQTATACAGAKSSIGDTCVSCLYSQLSASQWGVLIDTPYGLTVANEAGCYAQQGYRQCGLAIEEQFECEVNACPKDPKLTTPDTDFQTCQTKADSDACACYVTNASNACSSYASSACTQTTSQSFEQAFLMTAAVMCL